MITGASHTGKTAATQKLLERYKYPYVSIDHLKMGLLRSGNTELTPMSEKYIRNHFGDIKKYARVVENRLDDERCTLESILEDNAQVLVSAQKYNANYMLIDDEYKIDIVL